MSCILTDIESGRQVETYDCYQELPDNARSGCGLSRHSRKPAPAWSFARDFSTLGWTVVSAQKGVGGDVVFRP